MKKKLLSALLATAMTASMLAGCGSDAASGDAADNTAASTEAADGENVAADEGKVLNIYCWNDEFQRRLKAHYDKYEEVDATTGKIGDITVKWNITPSDDNAYQNNLDANLLAQDSAAADDKIDILIRSRLCVEIC